MTKQEVKSFRGDFQVDSNDEFKIVKINNKNIKVQKINVGDGRIGALINVTPGLLVKK